MIVRIINLIVALGVLIWSIAWFRKNHGSELYAGPVIIWAIHSTVYHAVILYEAIVFGTTTTAILRDGTWSAGLRLHSTATIILFVYALHRFHSRSIYT